MKALGKKGFGTTWKPNELRVTLWCGLSVVVKEERLETRRRSSGKFWHVLHDGGRLVALTMCTYSLAGWEEFIMNETVSSPPNAEYERLLEAAGFGRLSIWLHVTHTLRLLRLHFSSPAIRTLKIDFVLRVLWRPAIESPIWPLAHKGQRANSIGYCCNWTAQALEWSVMGWRGWGFVRNPRQLSGGSSSWVSGFAVLQL